MTDMEAAVAIEGNIAFEREHGTAAFLKVMLSAVNRVLVEKGVCTAHELIEASVAERTLFIQRECAPPTTAEEALQAKAGATGKAMFEQTLQEELSRQAQQPLLGTPRARVMHLFHLLWGQAHTREYNKASWMELQAELERLLP